MACGIGVARNFLAPAERTGPGRGTFSPGGLQDADKFAHFCGGICSTFVGDAPNDPSPGPFDASFSALEMDEATLAMIEAPGHDVVRDKAMLRRFHDDAIYLNHMEVGECRVEHAGESKLQRRGSTVLLDSTRPFRLDFTRQRGFRLGSLRLPRHIFAARNDTMTRCLGIVLEDANPLGHLIGQQMQLLIEAARYGDPDSAKALGAALTTMLARLPDELTAVPKRNVGQEPAEFAAIARFAEANLGNPALSARYIAGAFGCTARTVQMRFKAHNTTLTAWIMQRRLEHARGMLTSERYALESVATIAHRCGFCDATHFSRAFRARYGLPPAQFRRYR